MIRSSAFMYIQRHSAQISFAGITVVPLGRKQPGQHEVFTLVP